MESVDVVAITGSLPPRLTEPGKVVMVRQDR